MTNYEPLIKALKQELGVVSHGKRRFHDKQSEYNYLVYMKKNRQNKKFNWSMSA